MKLKTTLKQPTPPDSRRYIDRYLNELIDYGGTPMTRGEVIRTMQQEGHEQACIDRWLQGNELAQRIRRRRERISLSLHLQ